MKDTNEGRASAALSSDELERMDKWWRAANYLSVGQIYLLDNPLLREKLTLAHVKPRLLGHWGTTPGLNFLYLHLNRIIRERGVSVLFVAGPGHGAPGVVAQRRSRLCLIWRIRKWLMSFATSIRSLSLRKTPRPSSAVSTTTCSSRLLKN